MIFFVTLAPIVIGISSTMLNPSLRNVTLLTVIAVCPLFLMAKVCVTVSVTGLSGIIREEFVEISGLFIFTVPLVLADTMFSMVMLLSVMSEGVR